MYNLFNKIEKLGKNIRLALGKLEYGSPFCWDITRNKLLTNLLSSGVSISSKALSSLEGCGDQIR